VIRLPPVHKTQTARENSPIVWEVIPLRSSRRLRTWKDATDRLGMLHARSDSMRPAPGRRIELRQVAPQVRDAASPRLITGWLAVLASTGLSCFWAFWGSIENFHEGWYFREWWRNAGLAVVQYLPWMFLPMVAGLLALWKRSLGVIVHLLVAASAFWLFGGLRVGALYIAVPLAGLATLYAYGRPQPVRLAMRFLVVAPILTAVVSGAYPAYRVLTRPGTVDTSMRRIPGNSVDLVWAPEGPGWDTIGFSWFEAQRRCEYLTADGSVLAAASQRIWRLPTVDEVVRTMVFRGSNAGGSWDAASRKASYRVMPDKDAPLWHPYSPVIYWWTADEVGSERAFRVSFNGGVYTLPKRSARGYLGCRCVKA
jgi:hypothetical protein